MSCSVPAGRMFMGPWGGSVQRVLPSGGLIQPQTSLIENNYVGMTGEATIETALFEEPCVNSDGRSGGAIDIARAVQQASVRLVVRALRSDVMAHALLGKLTEYTGGPVTGELKAVVKGATTLDGIASTLVQCNRVPDMAQPLIVRNAAGTVTYVEGTDYLRTYGGIEVLSSGSIPSSVPPLYSPAIALTYQALDTQRVDAYTRLTQKVSLYFDGIDRLSGRVRQGWIYKAVADVRQLPFKTDGKLAFFQFDLKLLEDERIAPLSSDPTGQYFHFVNSVSDGGVIAAPPPTSPPTAPDMLIQDNQLSASVLAPGSSGTYSFKLKNVGSASATAGTVALSAPASVTVNSVTFTNTGTSLPTNPTPAQMSSGVSIGSFPTGVSEAVCTVGFTVNANAAVGSHNFTVSITGVTPAESNGSNNTVTNQLTVTSAPNLKFTGGSFSAASYATGQNGTFTFGLANDGGASATNATLAMPAPSGVTITSVSIANSGSALPTAPTPAQLAAGFAINQFDTTDTATVVVSFTATAVGTAAFNATLSNITPSDGTSGDNALSSSVSIVASGAPDMDITDETLSATTLAPNATGTVTFNVKNVGSVAASAGVSAGTLAMSAPAGITINSVGIVNSNTAMGTAPTPAQLASGISIGANFPTNGVAAVTVGFTVNAGASGTAVFAPTISGVTPAESSTSNNTGSSSALTLTISSGSNPAAPTWTNGAVPWEIFEIAGSAPSLFIAPLSTQDTLAPTGYRLSGAIGSSMNLWNGGTRYRRPLGDCIMMELGGHNDHWRNGLSGWDFSQNTPAFKDFLPPSSANPSQFSNNQRRMLDGGLSPNHGFNNWHTLGTDVVRIGASAYSSSGFFESWVDGVDFSNFSSPVIRPTNHYATPIVQYGSVPGCYPDSAFAHDTKRNHVVVQWRLQAQIYKYRVAENDWVPVSNSYGNTTAAYKAVFMPNAGTDGLALIFANSGVNYGAIASYDQATHNIANALPAVTLTGLGISDWTVKGGLTYSEKIDKVVVYNNDDATTLRLIDNAMNVTAQATTLRSGSARPLTIPNGVYSKFMEIRVPDGSGGYQYFLIFPNEWNGNLRAVKLP